MAADGGRHRAVRVGPRLDVTAVGADADVMKDVRFIGDLIGALQASYDIDPARIFANGLSNGGGMAFVLSCRMPTESQPSVSLRPR